MGKAKRCKLARRRRPQHSTDPVMQELFTPLLQAVGHEEKGWAIIERGPSGVLAWGVQTGYLLWVRHHPGQIPTMRQVRAWVELGKGRKAS